MSRVIKNACFLLLYLTMDVFLLLRANFWNVFTEPLPSCGSIRHSILSWDHTKLIKTTANKVICAYLYRARALRPERRGMQMTLQQLPMKQCDLCEMKRTHKRSKCGKYLNCDVVFCNRWDISLSWSESSHVTSRREEIVRLFIRRAWICS